MIIYITQKQIKDKHGAQCDSLEAAYIKYFESKKLFGHDAIYLPVANNIFAVKALLNHQKPDLIILSGGNNVMPSDTALHEQVADFCIERDEVEKLLVEYADIHQVPKIAICRGFQYLNKLYGGEITYFLSEHQERKHPCLYENQEYTVNSYHQHGILSHQLSSLLKPIAFTKDQHLIEGYVHHSTNISPTLGVQWHPERDNEGESLFEILWDTFKQ